MKKIAPLFLLLICFTIDLNAQVCKDLAIPTTVVVQKTPARITINWTALANGVDIKVYRRNKGATSWNLLTTLAANATQYIDNAVTTGIEYEYYIYKAPVAGTGNVESLAYLSSGIEVDPIEYRGVIILVIDSTFKTSLASSINTLKQDLIGDGWQVKSFYAKRTDAVTVVKNKIINLYLTDSINTKAVYLLGHVPVPYSGDYAPDAHTNNHKGAWPADNYYGDRTSHGWTDQYVNNTSASGTRNDNIPGDGKFDNDEVPPPNHKIELQIGRVDLHSMPEFSGTEAQLLAQYITKSHNYKHKVFNAQRRMLIDDNFGYTNGEAFAASGWRNGYSLVGGANVSANDYFSTLATNDYLLSYGCGGGTFTSCSGVGTTGNFDSTDVKTVFTLLFGSYFGDWDSQNNFLRAPLASKGWGLASAWSGRPYWIMHHMGMGENIGYSTQITQNNYFVVYKTNAAFGSGTNWIALMGDPSLRLHTIAPAKNLTATPILSNTQISLAWTASSDVVLGYHIYRQNPTTGIYTRINTNIVTGLSYTDSLPGPGQNYYMVRAVKLETASGSYFNLSQGIFDTAMSWVGIEPVVAATNIKLFPNPANTNLSIQFDNMTTDNNLRIVFYDMLGKAITMKVVNIIGEASNSININVENLTPGVYTCSFEFEQGYRHSERLVIVR